MMCVRGEGPVHGEAMGMGQEIDRAGRLSVQVRESAKQFNYRLIN